MEQELMMQISILLIQIEDMKSVDPVELYEFISSSDDHLELTG